MKKILLIAANLVFLGFASHNNLNLAQRYPHFGQRGPFNENDNNYMAHSNRHS
jgi:proline dehydrogenase